MHDLSGKTILLTGASSGIGAATARVLAGRGARLIAHYAGGTSARAGAEQADALQPAVGRKSAQPLHEVHLVTGLAAMEPHRHPRLPR